jgi:hypothetical protein
MAQITMSEQLMAMHQLIAARCKSRPWIMLRSASGASLDEKVGEPVQLLVRDLAVE